MILNKYYTTAFFLVLAVFTFAGNEKSTTSYSNLKKAFQHPEKVEVLDLSYQQLASLTDSIGLFTNLKTLNLSNNKISKLPLAINKLKKLKTLNLNNNQFVDQNELFENLSNLKNLQNLSLNNCMLFFIPASISNAKSLKKLSINNNFIKELPNQISKLKKLEFLDLSNNQIKKLPTSFVQLARLSHLNLSNNFNLEMNSIFEALGIMKLDYLKFEGIKPTPSNLTLLENTKTIIFKNCNFITPIIIENSNFSAIKLSNCKGVDYDKLFNELSNHQLKELTIIDRNINNLSLELLNSKKIKGLTLQLGENTNWDDIGKKLISFNKLKRLNLSNNKLTDYPKSINNIESLNYLNVSNNNLSDDEVLTINNKNLKQLELSLNPINQKSVALLKRELATCLVQFKKEEVDENKSPFITPPLENLQVGIEKIVFDAGKSKNIKLNSGTVIKIPENSFVDQFGNSVTGNVSIEVKEFKNPTDIFLSGIPMVYDSAGVKYDFSSAGMMDIQVYQNGKKLKLSPSKQLEIDMVSVNENDDFNFYELDNSSGTWKNLRQDVSASNIQTETIDSNDFNQMFMLETRRNAKTKLPNLYTEKVFFKVKKYSKLKSFKISLLDYTTIVEKEDLCKQYPEYNLLRKYEWLYEGSEMNSTFKMLDSLSRVIRKSYRGFEEKDNKKRSYSPKRYSIDGSTIIEDIYLKANPDADNFLLIIIVLGNEITLPVSILTNDTKAKKIKKMYSEFYINYSETYQQRRETWNLQEKSYKIRVDDYNNNEWSEQELARGTKYKRKYSDRPIRSFTIGNIGITNIDMTIPLNNTKNPRLPLIADYYEKTTNQAIQPTNIYVLDYSANSVYSSTQIRDSYYYPASKSAIIVKFNNNKLGLLSSKEFEKTMISGEKRQLYFTIYNSSDISLKDLQQIGNSN